MDNKFISVKVSGNPAPNGGFGPLIMFNNPRFELKDVFYGGFESNSYYFSIRIDQSQVVYKIIKNNVRSYGAIRAGALSLAFSIPKGYKVDGYTPYEVLMGLLDTFLKNCMTCRDEQAGTYEFNDVRVPLDALDETAEKYTLIESKSPWHTMSDDTCIGCIQADEIQIEQLMNDVQYDDFEKYSEVLIAEKVGDKCTFNHITGLEIPRRPVYTIVVDNDSNSIDKTKEVDNLITIEPKVDSRYYEWKPIKFTISELLNGDCIEGVDREAEIIKVSTDKYKKPRDFKIRVVFTENEAAIYSHKNQIKVSYNGQEISLNDDFMFTLKGEEYKQLDSLDRYKITAPDSLGIKFGSVPTFNSDNNELIWDTKKIEKAKPIDTNTVQLPITTIGNKQKTETNKSDVFKLVLVMEESNQNEAIIKSIGSVKSNIVVKKENSDEIVSKNKLVLSQDTTKLQGKVKRGKSHARNNKSYLKDEIRIPKPLTNGSKYIVSMYVGNKKYTTDFCYYEEQCVDDCWQVNFSDFTQISRPLKEVIMPNRLITFLEGFFLCVLLIGGGMIIKNLSCNNNKIPEEIPQEPVQEPVQEPSLGDNDDLTNDEISNKLKELDKTLEIENLTFAEVYSIYNKYISMGSERCKEIDPMISKRIENYKNVATFISNHQYNDIRDNIDNMNLHLVHKRLVKLITHGVLNIPNYNNHDYNITEIRNVKDLFSQNTFDSFSGLKKIAEPYKKKSELSPPKHDTSEPAAVPEL